MSTTLAKERRDIGIERSAKACGDEWQESARAFLKTYLETHETMHVDRLWSAGLSVPKSPRGLGAVIQHAVRERWMETISMPGGYTAALPSSRSNQQLKPVWRSLLYRPATVERQCDLFGDVA